MQDGGVYLEQLEAAARAWYTPEWAARMEAPHGVKPVVTSYGSLFDVDNETGEGREQETRPSSMHLGR